MNSIDYDRAFSVSERWAQELAYIAVGYAVDSHLDDEQWNQHQRLTSKEWERLCTFFIIPNEKMDSRLNFNFEGFLTKQNRDHVVNFIKTEAQKKVLDVLLLDHGMLFELREEILNEALDYIPMEALWEPKSSIFLKNYTCVFDEEHFRATITHFICDHLNPLLPEKVSLLVHQAIKPLKRSSQTSSTGPR